MMINTFLYSVYGQSGGEVHKDDQGIVDYRNSWLRSIFGDNAIEVVVALGSLADDAWQKWTQTPWVDVLACVCAVTHPTEPESSSGGDPAKLKAAIAAMLANWNSALAKLHPLITHPDVPGPLVPYGDSFKRTSGSRSRSSTRPPGSPSGCARRPPGRSASAILRPRSAATSR